MAKVSQFPSGQYPLGQFPGGEYPLSDARVYEGADTGWPPPDAQPQDWLYTLGATEAIERTRVVDFPASSIFLNKLGQRDPYAYYPGIGDPTIVEAGSDWYTPSTEPTKEWPFVDWPYTIGAISDRKAHRRGLRGLGDDTPDSIRIYVPRLAAGLYALDLFETGLTSDAMPPIEPIASQRWNNRIATKFAQEANRYLGFVPVVHEPEGSDVIYAHMLGASSHTAAETMWKPFQAALNRARRATGVGAPNDPYAGQPRAWEEGAGGGGGGGGEALPPPIHETLAQRGVWDLITGIAMVVGGIVIF